MAREGRMLNSWWSPQLSAEEQNPLLDSYGKDDEIYGFNPAGYI